MRTPMPRMATHGRGEIQLAPTRDRSPRLYDATVAQITYAFRFQFEPVAVCS